MTGLCLRGGLATVHLAVSVGGWRLSGVLGAEGLAPRLQRAVVTWCRVFGS